MKTLQFLLVAVLILLAVGVFIHWFGQPQRTRERFASVMFEERYADAASMLQPDSEISMSSEGLVIFDRNRFSTLVPRHMLPFQVVGHDGDREHDLVMTALGPSVNGILNEPPVTIHLSVVGDRVVIEAIER